jgi:hypothetical protein
MIPRSRNHRDVSSRFGGPTRVERSWKHATIGRLKAVKHRRRHRLPHGRGSESRTEFRDESVAEAEGSVIHLAMKRAR